MCDAIQEAPLTTMPHNCRCPPSHLSCLPSTDAAAVEAHARAILEGAGRDPGSIPTADIKHFCKHARYLRQAGLGGDGMGWLGRALCQACLAACSWRPACLPTPSVQASPLVQMMWCPSATPVRWSTHTHTLTPTKPPTKPMQAGALPVPGRRDRPQQLPHRCPACCPGGGG